MKPSSTKTVRRRASITLPRTETAQPPSGVRDRRGDPAVDLGLAHRPEMRAAEATQLTMRPRSVLLDVDGMTLGELLREALCVPGEDDVAIAALTALGCELDSIAARQLVFGCSREAVAGTARRAKVTAEVLKRARRNAKASA